jgi:nitrite reductase/ring-hydroxylating ferredoxin subunit
MGWREHRYAPALGTPLCRMDSVAVGACKEFRYGEGEDALSLLVYRGALGIRAYVNKCPHFSLPLNARPDKFLLLKDSQIMCAYHCAIFRLDDGHCIAGPAEGMGLEPVAIVVADGNICLDTQ